jgi:hypothetical protein
VADIALTPRDQDVAQIIFRITSAIIVIAVVYALWDWKRNKSPVPLLIIAGGVLANLCEPFVDIVAGCFMPIIGNDRLFELMGRQMPVWLLPAYVATFGVEAMAIYIIMRSGARRIVMWLCYLLPVVANIVLELYLLNSSDHLYVYYGNQPLTLFKFPLWWAFVNVLGFYLVSFVLSLLRQHLTGWKLLLIPLATPLLDTASMGFAGLPTAIAVNSDVPDLIIQLAGLATIFLALAAVWATTFVAVGGLRFGVADLATS